MNQKNDKNTKLILIKNRRILTRTELSKQKLHFSNNENSFIYQTPKPHEKNTFKCIQRQNQTQLKINLKDTQNQVFWKKAIKKRVKSELDSNPTTSQLKQMSDRRNNPALMQREKSLKSRLFDHRGKIFSHKNLNQRFERPKTKHSKSSSKINQQNLTYIDTKEEIKFHKESLRNSQRGQFQKGSKAVERRLKTENFSTNQRLEEILENIYTHKRRKLRLNSKQYSLDVESIIGLQENKESNELNDLEGNQKLRKIDSARTQNKNQSMKLPKDLINKINSHSGNLRFSSNQETPKNKKFHKFKQVDSQNLNQTSSQQLHQQNTEKHQKLSSKAFIHKKFKKKDTHHLEIQTKSNNYESNTLSIQDIKIDCQSNIQSSRQIHQTINCQPQTKNEKIKLQYPNESYTNGNKQFLKNGLYINQKKRHKTKLKQEVKVPIPIKNKDKQSIYMNSSEMDFIEEINFDQNRKEVQKVIKRSNQNSLDFQKIQGKFLMQQNTQNKKRNIKDGQKIKSLVEKNNEKLQTKFSSKQNLKKKFQKTKQIIDYLTCTGEVAGYCLQIICKKNRLWMAPSLLLYLYCFNVSQRSKQVFAEVLKNQLCSQNQYQIFIQQNELLKSNLQKLYQKAKKKGVLNEITESLICEGSDCTRKNRQFFLILFEEVRQFIASLKSSSTAKDPQQRKNQLLCGTRMISSLLKAFKSEFQSSWDQQSNDNNTNTKMFVATVEIPEIKFQNSNEKKAQACLSQLHQLMQTTFYKFRELSHS